MTFWETSGCTATGGWDDPAGETGAIKMVKSPGSILFGLRQDITSNEFEGKEVALRVWLLAGSAAANDEVIEIALRNVTGSAWLPVKSVTWVSGHFPTLSTDDGAVFNDLSDTVWSEVEIVWDAVALELDCYVFFAPDLISVASGTTYIYRPQLQHARVADTDGFVSTGVRQTEAINGPEGAPGELVTVRVSNNGWATAPTDTPASVQFPAVLGDPYKLRVAPFVGAGLAPRLTPSYGEIILANPNGEFDHLLDLSWDNREITLYQGKWEQTLDEFLTYSVGSSTGVEAEQYVIVVRYADRMQLLDKYLQEAEFKGLGMGLRFDGSTGEFVGMGANGWTWTLTDDITLEVIARFYSDPSKKVVLFDKSSDFSGEEFNRTLSLRYDCTNNRLEYEHAYGGTPSLETHNSGASTVPTAYKSDGLWHHYAVVRGTTAKTLTFYVDGEEVGTTTYTNQPTGGWRGGCRIGRDDSTTAWDLEGDVAEFRVFRSARAAKDIKKFYDRSLTETDEESLVGLWRLNEGTGTIAGNEQFEDVWHAAGKSDGVDDGATTGTSPTISLATSFTLAVWLQTDGQNNNTSYIFGQGSWGSAARILLRTSTASPGLLQWEYESSTYGETKWGGTGLNDQTGKLYCLVLTFDDDNDLLTSYVNYNEKVQTWDYIRAGNWDLTQLAFGSNAAITSNWFGGQIFQAAIWSKALSAEEVEALNDTGDLDLTDTTLEVAYNFETWDDITSTGKDFTTTTGVALLNSNGTVNLSEWVGSGEGGIELLGKARPTIVGRVHHVEPVLLDPFNFVYYVAEGPLHSITAVYEGGDEKTLEWTTNADIWSVSPTLDYVVNLDTGLLKAKSVASYPVTVDVQGDDTDGAYLANAGGIIKSILTRRGDLTWPDDFNTGSFASIDQSSVLGIYTGLDNFNIIAAMNWIMGSIHGSAYMDRAALVSVTQVPELGATDAPTFEINTNEIVEGTVELLPLIPTWREKVHYGRYWKTLSDQEVVGLAAGKKTDLAQEYRSVTEEDEDIKTAWKSSDTYEVLTALYSDGAATTEAEARFARFAMSRRFVTLVIPLGLVGINVGAVGTLYYPRWGMQDEGKRVFVVQYEEDLSVRQVRVMLWC